MMSYHDWEKIMKPIRLEIVTKMIIHFDHCSRCQVLFNQTGLNKKIHQKEIEEYPPDLKEEDMKLSEWIRELTRLYKHRLLIQLIDAQSPQGIYKSLRHRIRNYPTFIVEGKETYTGWDKYQLENLLDKYIQGSLQSKRRPLQASLL